MTKNHKKELIQFITRTGMYIHPVDKSNVVSFVHGYEIGTQNKCDFIEMLKNHISTKFKINGGAMGWPNQIELLSMKLSNNWLITFKKIGLDVLLMDSSNNYYPELCKILKVRIQTLIDRIDFGHNNNFVAEWLSYCLVEHQWFQKIWTDKEFEIIKEINQEVIENNNCVCVDKNQYFPTLKLNELKEKYSFLKK